MAARHLVWRGETMWPLTWDQTLSQVWPRHAVMYRHRLRVHQRPFHLCHCCQAMGTFFGNQTLIFCGNMNFFATFFAGKISLFTGDTIDCRFQTVLAMALLVSDLVDIYLLAESPVLCQCDGRVFIRAATCGIPLLAARISRDNYPLGPPPPSKLFSPLSFTRYC